ncbi:hypothetical protein G9A89_001423 [Geosiphon pyriformis]|nr:hypothetical protein G9A89_001423 [Geosiphon pyriformis]
MDTVTSNQLGKMTNAQFEELQTQITQIYSWRTYGEINLLKQYLLLEDLQRNRRQETALVYTYGGYCTKKIINHQAEQAIDETTVSENY